jgi:hypothetical protein
MLPMAAVALNVESDGVLSLAIAWTVLVLRKNLRSSRKRFETSLTSSLNMANASPSSLIP